MQVHINLHPHLNLVIKYHRNDHKQEQRASLVLQRLRHNRPANSHNLKLFFFRLLTEKFSIKNAINNLDCTILRRIVLLFPSTSNSWKTLKLMLAQESVLIKLFHQSLFNFISNIFILKSKVSKSFTQSSFYISKSFTQSSIKLFILPSMLVTASFFFAPETRIAFSALSIARRRTSFAYSGDVSLSSSLISIVATTSRDSILWSFSLFSDDSIEPIKSLLNSRIGGIA